MSIDYTAMAATATRLLTDDGQAMSLRRTTPGTFDPVTGTSSGDTTTDLVTTGIFTKISTGYAMTNEVQQGDRMALIDASQAPKMTDKLVVGASVLSIVNIVAINPAGTPVAYKIQVRGT